jgi:hypothetical protein
MRRLSWRCHRSTSMTKRWPRLCDRRVRTKKEAVNLAMRDCVERFRRVETLARSREQAKGWDYEGWLAARADEKAVGPPSPRLSRGNLFGL